MYSFSYLEPVCCSMFSSNCCFLTCIQVSQEAGQMVWYSHLFQNFPQFIVIHSVKGFDIANKAEIDVFLEFSCFFSDPADVGNLISGSSVFSKFSTVYYIQYTYTTHVYISYWLYFFWESWWIQAALCIQSEYKGTLSAHMSKAFNTSINRRCDLT